MEPVVTGLLIFVARVINVSMATVRTLLGLRGHKRIATAIGFFESLIFVLAISSVLQNVNSIWNVLGYSGGFAVGTLVGLTIEERLALGYAMVQAISREAGGEIAEALREAGYGATEMVGQGLSGTVQVITTVANRREIATIARIVSDVDSSAFVTIDDANRVYRGYTQRPGHG